MPVGPHLARMVNEEIERCRALMTPMGVFEKCPVSLEQNGVVSIRGVFLIHSADLYKWVEGCDEMAVMAVSLGSGITAYVEELVGAGEVTRGMVADAIGSETVEELANLLNRIIINTIRRAATKRYSPGYGDWDLSDQAALLGLIDARRIGIEVNPSSQMVPEKSISAVIGIRDRIGKRT